MSLKYANGALYALILIVIVTTGTAYALAHLGYALRAPIAVSRNFVDLIQAGDLDGAYRLTNQKASVGSSPQPSRPTSATS
jgi:hypothetical protein